MSQPAFVCDMTAMDAAQRARHTELGARLQDNARTFEEVDNGYSIQFPSDNMLFVELAEFITLEHLCCPFLTLGLEMEADSGPVWLRISGPEGVKEFVQAEFGLS